jgi:hypothetical protein
MKRFAALLAVTTFSVMGCDDGTLTEPDPAGLRLTAGSSQANASSADRAPKVRIGGSAEIYGRVLAVPGAS